MDFFNAQLSVQVALVGGFFGYAVGYAGYKHAHKISDGFMIFFAFGLISTLIYQTVSGLGIGHGLIPDMDLVPSVIIAVGATVILAAIWRSIGRTFVFKALRFLGVHHDDGNENPWDTIVGDRSAVQQVSVHLTDGRVLYMSDRTAFVGYLYEGLLLGSDGSVALAVQEEELPPNPDGTVVEEQRENVAMPDSGVRLTYIPKSQITRINIRVMKVEPQIWLWVKSIFRRSPK